MNKYSSKFTKIFLLLGFILFISSFLPLKVNAQYPTVVFEPPTDIPPPPPVYYWPSLQNITINSPTVIADGNTEYTITMTATDQNGGTDISDQWTIINYLGANAASPRGLISWSDRDFAVLGGTAAMEPFVWCTNTTTGQLDGKAAIYNNGWGNQYIRMELGCKTSTVGNTRSTSVKVTFDPNFTAPLNGNTFSGYVYDSIYLYDGWREYPGFNLIPPSSSPIVQNVSINSPTVSANGSNQYQITMTSSDGNGGGDVADQWAIINYLGANAPNYRGLLAYSNRNFAILGGPAAMESVIACGGNGGGSVAIYNNGWGYQYINTVGACTSIISGNIRTTVMTVVFDPSFTAPITGNTFSGYVYDTAYNFDQWREFPGFNLNVKPALQNVTINSPTVVANGSYQYQITMTATDANGGGDIGDQWAIINYLGANGAYPRGLPAWSNRDFAALGGLGAMEPAIACGGNGGGKAAIYAFGWGNQYINTVGACTSTISGNTRTTVMTVVFDPSFTMPTSGNTFSGLVYDTQYLYDGYIEYPGFNLNTGPTLQNVTINSPTVTANGTNQYQVTMTASDANGGADVADQWAIINYLGANSPNYRGLLVYSKRDFAVLGGLAAMEPAISCGGNGGGKVAIYNNGWGYQYVNAVGTCTSTISGNTRTTVMTVVFDPSFTMPTSGNTFSGYVYDTEYLGHGYIEYPGFNLNIKPALQNVTINSPTVTANGTNQYQVTMTATDANGGADVADQWAIINWLGANNPNYRGLLAYSKRDFAPLGGIGAMEPAISCGGNGGGKVAIYNNAWGYQYVNAVGTCTSTISGNTRTTVMTVVFDPSFTSPTTGNTFSGFVYDTDYLYDGYIEYPGFNLLVTISGKITNPNTGSGIDGVIINPPASGCNTAQTTTSGGGNWSLTLAGGSLFCVRPTTPTGFTNPVATNSTPAGQVDYICQVAGKLANPDGCGATPSKDLATDNVFNFSYTPLPLRNLTGNIYVDSSFDNCSTTPLSTYTGGGKVNANSASYPSTNGNISTLNGTYTVTVTSGTNYSASLSNIPTKYTVRGIRNSSSGAFTPLLSFSYIPAAPNIDLTTDKVLDWCVLDARPWIQTGDGDVRFPSYNNPVPSSQFPSTSNNPLAAFFSSLTTSSFGAGTSGSFIINGEFSQYNDDPQNKQGLFSYTFFMNRAKIKAVPVNNLVGTSGVSCTGNSCSISNLPTGVYHFPNVGSPKSNLTITSYTHGTCVPPAACPHVLILVNGDVTINTTSNLKVPAGVGNLFIVAAKDNIIFPAGVGSTAAVPCGTSACTNVEGMYSAEGSITLESSKNCSASTPVPDKQFTLAGNLITNALKPFRTGGNGKFVNQRSLCDDDNNFPVFVIQSRYDFIPQLTDFYKVPSVRWKELNP